MISPQEEIIIQEWMDKNVAELALHFSGSDVRVPFIADQIKGRKKIKEKFPFLKEFPTFVFPAYLSVEQSSSQFTAYAKSLFIQGSKVLDMTGGMGIDAYFLSQENESYTLVEQNEELVHVNRHNFEQLGRENVHIVHGDSIDFLKKTEEKFDVIYIDPARRAMDGSNRKVFLLEDLRPNVLELINLFWEKADDVWIKLSPLIDISYLASALDNVREIMVISVKNEVKEVLVHLQKEIDPSINPERISLHISGNMSTSFLADDLYSPTRIDQFHPFEQYIYEPSKSIIKAGLADKAAEMNGLKKMQSNTYFYSLNQQLSQWDGRIFKADRLLSARPKQFKRDFPHKKANIISRNHPMSAKTIAKKFNITEGGDRYILAFSDTQGRHIISAKRIQ